MNDLIRSMRGESGPRIARAAIKRLRNWSFWFAVAWAAVCATIGSIFGAGFVRGAAWAWPLAVAVVSPIFAVLFAASGCEIQIRHLNGLALSPFEKMRMDKRGANRMWSGAALILVAIVAVIIGVALPLVQPWRWLCLILAALLFATGYFLTSYKTGLGWFSPNWPPYNPDTDDFGLW